MVIGPGQEPTREQSEDFLARWPGLLEQRLEWFRGEVGAGAPDPAGLDDLVRSVVGRIGEDRPVEPVPEWYGEALRGVGWSAYGAALAEGLMAHVAAIYAAHLDGPLPWVLDTDPKSAYHLRPVVDAPGIAPPWRQVMGVLRQAQGGGDAGRLREAVEHSLHAWAAATGAPAPVGAGQVDDGPIVVLTEVGRRRWQVSFPEDVDVRLGRAYDGLEAALAAVDGVTEAVMEDRDRALVSTRRGVDQAALEARVTRAVEALGQG